MKKNTASDSKKLTLTKSTIQNLGVTSGIQTGLFKPVSNNICGGFSKAWGNCVP